MPFRRTKGILGDATDPVKDADVIMTAAILGFAADYVRTEHKPIRFDIDKKDANPYGKNGEKEKDEWVKFTSVIVKMREVLNRYLDKPTGTSTVDRWCTPDYKEGGVIVGLGPGIIPPPSVTRPQLSKEGQDTFEAIRDLRIPHYSLRGAYTGFVDIPKFSPVGPLPTARFKVPVPGSLPLDPYPRWLPPFAGKSLDLWNKRKRIGRQGSAAENYIPWGLLLGDKAGKEPDKNGLDYEPPQGFEKNLADQATVSMFLSGMKFTDAPWLLEEPRLFTDEVWGYASDYIAAYTHGMIQAIYKTVHIGHEGIPYEIAVGNETTKLASCIPCTLFMYATGFPPTSIHLGRGESWAPLYKPYDPWNPNLREVIMQGEQQVIDRLNNQWYEKCFKWLKLGLEMLIDNVIKEEHRQSRDTLHGYLNQHMNEHMFGQIPTVGGILILDAITIHDSETNRLDRTLNY